MKVQRLQGLALILSAVCLLIGVFGPQSFSLIGPQATTFYLIVSGVLYILGIPAVHSTQPTGWLGLTGIVLLIIAALIPLLFRLDMVPSGLGGVLSLTSALAGMLGAIIIGWITIREHVFPAWIGWVFLAQGLLNFLAGQFNVGSLKGTMPVILPLLIVVVLFAYGYFIYQQSLKPTIASESKVPLA